MEKFPWTNGAGEAFEEKVKAAMGKRLIRAAQKLGLVIAFILLAGPLWWRLTWTLRTSS